MLYIVVSSLKKGEKKGDFAIEVKIIFFGRRRDDTRTVV